MAVHLVESPTQDTYSTVLCDSEKSAEHAYIIVPGLSRMVPPAVAVLVKAIVIDNAPIRMARTLLLDQRTYATCIHS